ncbi:MAG TPA: multicopper oxidase domain-containing protein [Propionibacteriaceae bacterium]
MTLSRRSFLTGSLGLAGATVLGTTACSTGSAQQTAVPLASRLPLPQRFVVPLEIPPVLSPQSTSGGVTRYSIVQRRARLEILPGMTTEIYGYDGLLPGPTIRTRRGERLVVTHRNTLDVPTVVHLHGGHTPAASDGYPVDLVLPEQAQPVRARHGQDHGAQGHATMTGDVSQGSRDYRYPGDQQAATLWYHDHRMDFTGPQVWRGLAGFHLISDDVEDRLDLPHGDRDVPLMVMDRAFEADGSLRYPSIDPELASTPGVTEDYVSGVLGDVILVNGRPWPVLEVAAVRYRFRILNASNARRYSLALDPAPPSGPSFVQIGSDAGLLAAPVAHTTITAAPAERFDVIVDFGGYPVGTEITLVNQLGRDATDSVMRFRVTAAARDDSRVPERLAPVPTLAAPSSVTREWRFTRGLQGQPHWVINQQPFDPRRMDARVRLGEVERWRFYSDLHHPVHVHLDPFQVITRGGRPPGAYDAGWKDTIDLRPGEYADVAVRFHDHVGPYLLHCHNLEHEDMAMMAAFETVRQ